MSRKRQNPREAERRFECTLHEGIRSLGWLLPETEDEVRAADEEDDGDSLELPPELRDPFAALTRDYSIRPRRRQAEPPMVDRTYRQELRRAAREGTGQITAEIEERMRRDRLAAEAKRKKSRDSRD